MPQDKQRRGRPPTFDRESALDAATDAFWRFGYEGASIAVLTEKMRVTPPTLYAAFRSKEGLYREVFARYRERRSLRNAALAGEQGSLYSLLAAHLREAAVRFADPAGPPGCMIALGSLQCGTQNECARRIASTERIVDHVDFVSRLEDARRLGELPQDADVHALARFYAAVHEGMAIQAVDGATAQELTAVVDVALAAWPRGKACSSDKEG